MGDFIRIPCTKIQQCLLLTYFVIVDLVASPRMTASVRHSVYIMERLNKPQLRAQAVRLLDNYSYSVIAKKLGHSKAWFSNGQSAGRRRQRNVGKTALNETTQRLVDRQGTVRRI